MLLGCTGKIREPSAFSVPGQADDGDQPGEDTPGSENEGRDGVSPLDPETDPSAGVEGCGERVLTSQPLRRLSSTQYRETLRDLLGQDLADPLLADMVFPETVVASGFANDAEANIVNTAESNAIEDNAERIANAILADPNPYVTGLLPCDLAADYVDADIDDCIDDFIDGFGKSAYRRPLTDGERSLVRGLYDALRPEQGAVKAWAGVMQFFVQAPALLYRVERGVGEVAPGLTRLSDYEMASRLSYFFLNSMPDEELFAEAEAGRLSTPLEIATQARRLMESPQFLEMLGAHHRDWLRLRELPGMTKETDLYPAYTPAVRDSLVEEISHFVRYVMEEADGTVATLFSSSMAPVNSTLAAFYGADAAGADEGTWVPAEIPERRGLLTLASFQSSQADSRRTNPIHRGAFYVKEVLCVDLPPFPANLDIQSALRDTSTLPTARERLAPIMENSPCNGCHVHFNPTGLAFENFDAAGQWRSQENGAEIDSSGSVMLDGVEHSFSGPLELSDLVAQSAQARECYSLQWFRDAVGRPEFAEDACSLSVVRQAVEDSEGDIRELLVAITQTDAFLYRPTVEVEP